MTDQQLLALMYDFYNKYTLRDQNKDIDYYINQFNKYSANNILVVGAGTGRVVIPLSNYARTTALDFDLERLKLLRKKCNTAFIICSDFLDIDNLSYYDLIIFPYSTIQFGGDTSKMYEIFNKLGRLMNNNSTCLFDISESFNNKPEKIEEFLFKNYCDDISSNVEVYYSSKKYKEYIEFLVRYKIFESNREVIENEKYCYYDRSLLNYSLNDNGLLISKIDDGYGSKILQHKHIYHCRRKNER